MLKYKNNALKWNNKLPKQTQDMNKKNGIFKNIL